MPERKKSSIPFVNLHGHTTYSVSDGLGYPDEHCDYAFENGLEGMAFTEHGNCNSLSHAFMKSKKMKEQNKNFKIIYGIEAYIIPSVEEWKSERERHKEDSRLSKQIDDEIGLVVEDESESKKIIKNKLNQRSHLVMVAQNQKGLNNLYKLVSESYRGNNFYRFPRMDYEMLKKYNEGIIASSACLGGPLANDYWANRENGEAAILSAMEKTVQSLMDVFGNRFYGELQWGNYAEQHIVNQYIIQLSKQFGFELITTCDSHFPNPDMWKDREIYKMLGWMGKKDDDANRLNLLPQKLEEMEYQLYPKNGDELFAHYRQFAKQQGFTYDDNLIRESIERTSEIAKNQISDYTPDTSIQLPSFVSQQGELPEQTLTKITIEAMKKTGLYKNKEYVDRLKEELFTIKDRGFSTYFLTMKKIVDDSKTAQLCGGGRGSGAGSLVAYLLNITEADPIKYKLQFSRFIRNGPPVGEVASKEESGVRKVSQIVKIKAEGKEILLSPDTSVKVVRDGKEIYVTARNLKKTDILV